MPQWSAPIRWCLNLLGGGAPKGPERRRSVRYPCCLETSCQSTAAVEGDPWPAKIRNISLSGLSLVASRSFDPGATLTLTLHNPAQTYSRSLLVKVVHATPHPGGDWILGVIFTRKLTDYDLKMLLAGVPPVPVPKGSTVKPR